MGGMFRVVTDLAVFGFDDDTRRMKVVALNPGVTREQVQDNTGFELVFDRGDRGDGAADAAGARGAARTRSRPAVHRVVRKRT